MTDTIETISHDSAQKKLLSLTRTVKGQVLNAKNMYVEVDCKKPMPKQKNQKTETQKSYKELLNDLSCEVAECQACPLSKTRKNVVFGDGNPEARLVFVGEAPGADEDEQGLPFVGRAGQLLTNIIKAM
ncbi:MAG TPA: uracil-DNA glycosylase, partial [Smithellaceae bacterium]|nr:uracil-DNA glycosylase [Smithellaceae bacterium]